MPDSLELPGMRRAIVRLMRARDAVVLERVADGAPGFSAVVRTLYQLPGPGTVLRGIQPLRVGRRSLQMEYLPAREVGARNRPVLARCVGTQNERTFASPHKQSHGVHRPPRSNHPRFAGRQYSPRTPGWG